MYIEERRAKISLNKNSHDIPEGENCEGIAFPDSELNFQTELMNTVLYWSRTARMGQHTEQQTQKRPTWSIRSMVLANTYGN